MLVGRRREQEILEDMLQTLPVPKQREMDELYKEIYLLKKRIKALEKRSEIQGYEDREPTFGEADSKGVL